ncbi:hypothetical protein ABW19_dt0209016 [Dactylella cylindrospora]|nr:hypothetical protein ABW19_dt0209016 [Dactylella cylindrospora]
MQFILVLVAALAASVSAAPVGPAAVGAGVATGVGLICAFQASQCQAAGDAVREGATDFVAASGNRVLEGAAIDGGIGAGLADALAGFKEK